MKVLIGIQARSGSTRLPRKAFEMIAGRMMLDRVIEACKSAAHYIERDGHRCTVAVLTPTGDPIVQEFKSRTEIVQGSEHNVLERYRDAVKLHDPDFVVRVTGDCPLIPPSNIHHFVKLVLKNGYDYISNVDDRVRTSVDGADCEVISRRLFDYVADNARDKHDLEHVTTFIRRLPPEWAILSLVINHFDMSAHKLSVDTPEDLERVRRQFEAQYEKYQRAVHIYGRGRTHRVST